MSKIEKVLKHPLTHVAAVTESALLHTALKDHRDNTHASITLSEPVDLLLDVMGAPFTNSPLWAATHRIHHSATDANLLPAIEVADAVAAIEHDTSLLNGFELPEYIAGLDPAIPAMHTAEAVKLGILARQLIDGRYIPQEHYSREDLERIFHGQHKRYQYESPRGDMKNVSTITGFDASLWDLRYELRDPHAPPLHHMGMVGIAMWNMRLYEDVVRFYETNEQYLPPDITYTERERAIEDHKKQIRLGLVATTIAARLIADKPHTTGGIARSVLTGSLVAGGSVVGLVAGGNIVNSVGHGGEIHWNTLLKDLRSGTVHVKADGTYTTQTRSSLSNALTHGEVGGQQRHHERPGDIAYADSFREDPFGTLVKVMAENNVGISPGPGFPGAYKDRPDMPSEAVLYLQELRRAEYARTHAAR